MLWAEVASSVTMPGSGCSRSSVRIVSMSEQSSTSVQLPALRSYERMAAGKRAQCVAIDSPAANAAKSGDSIVANPRAVKIGVVKVLGHARRSSNDALQGDARQCCSHSWSRASTVKPMSSAASGSSFGSVHASESRRMASYLRRPTAVGAPTAVGETRGFCVGVWSTSGEMPRLFGKTATQHELSSAFFGGVVSAASAVAELTLYSRRN